MRIIYRKICRALSVHQKECRKSLGCALSIEKYGSSDLQMCGVSLMTASINDRKLAICVCVFPISTSENISSPLRFGMAFCH